MMPDRSHRRFNPLTGRWILVSPHRMNRPWLGREEDAPADDRPLYDPDCSLCPGNARTSGIVNPRYTSTFVFDNDFPALQEGASDVSVPADDLFRSHAESGLCRVVCFSPDHHRTLADLTVAEIRSVVDTWVDQTVELGRRPGIRTVQIFENKGQAMGCSNPHPHGQIWAQQSVPDEVAVEDDQQRHWLQTRGDGLLEQTATRELAEEERVVHVNDHFLVIVPFWAVWPFETLVLPRRRMARIPEMTDVERTSFARILSDLMRTYDRLFDTSFPYSAGIHQAPFTNGTSDHWHWHMHVNPPLLRSATVRKFMVGYEMFADPQRDLTAEAAARRLRQA